MLSLYLVCTRLWFYYYFSGVLVKRDSNKTNVCYLLYAATAAFVGVKSTLASWDKRVIVIFTSFVFFVSPTTRVLWSYTYVFEFLLLEAGGRRVGPRHVHMSCPNDAVCDEVVNSRKVPLHLSRREQQQVTGVTPVSALPQELYSYITYDEGRHTSFYS